MSDTKACPYCGEQILAVAVKCKHCGSALEGTSAAMKRQLRIRPLYAVLGVIVVVIFGGSWLYNWHETGSPTGRGYTDADVKRVEQDIRAEFEKRSGVIVSDVQMIKESPTKLTGFVKMRVPVLGSIEKVCTSTMGETGQSIWQCQ
jgi:hypothetical protein